MGKKGKIQKKIRRGKDKGEMEEFITSIQAQIDSRDCTGRHSSQEAEEKCRNTKETSKGR